MTGDKRTLARCGRDTCASALGSVAGSSFEEDSARQCGGGEGYKGDKSRIMHIDKFSAVICFLW